MKRPALVIGSAAALILLSLTQILMASLMGLAAALEHTHEIPTAPQATPALMYCLCAFFLCLAIWGIVTAVGLSKLRHWARYSILIIGGCMAIAGVVSAVIMLAVVVAFSAFAPPGATNPSASPAMVKAVLGVVALLYAVVGAIGIFWLVYFNRKTVRAIFAGGIEAEADDRRPILISIYAVLCLLSAAACLAMALVHFPAILFGVLFTGWKKALIYLACAAINAAIGVGLWKLAEWARRLALAFLAFGAAMMLAYLIWPSLILRNNEAVRQLMGVAQPLPEHLQIAMYVPIFGFSLLFMAAVAWMLHYYRSRFAAPAPATPIAGI